MKSYYLCEKLCQCKSIKYFENYVFSMENRKACLLLIIVFFFYTVFVILVWLKCLLLMHYVLVSFVDEKRDGLRKISIKMMVWGEAGVKYS